MTSIERSPGKHSGGFKICGVIYERRCAHDRLFGPDRRSTSSPDVDGSGHKGMDGVEAIARPGSRLQRRGTDGALPERICVESFLPRRLGVRSRSEESWHGAIVRTGTKEDSINLGAPDLCADPQSREGTCRCGAPKQEPGFLEGTQHSGPIPDVDSLLLDSVDGDSRSRTIATRRAGGFCAETVAAGRQVARLSPAGRPGQCEWNTHDVVAGTRKLVFRRQ